MGGNSPHLTVAVGYNESLPYAMALAQQRKRRASCQPSSATVATSVARVGSSGRPTSRVPLLESWFHSFPHRNLNSRLDYTSSVFVFLIMLSCCVGLAPYDGNVYNVVVWLCIIFNKFQNLIGLFT